MPRHPFTLVMSTVALLSGVILAVGAAAEDDVELVANGGFEWRMTGEPPAYIATFEPGVMDIVGWEVTSGSVDWIGPARWRAAEGRCCLDIDAPGAIQQTITTLPGADYVLSFEMAGNPETEPAAKRLRVRVNDDERLCEFDATGREPYRLGWASRQVVFRAVGERTTIGFANASPERTASGVALDNVSVRRCDAKESVPSASRFQLANAGGNIVLLDTTTGETWSLERGESGVVWRPIPRMP